LDDRSNFKIKGFGDPLLISEVVDEIARELTAKRGGLGKVHDLLLDDSYFKQPLTIPGITSSNEPYDAPNGALCVNFNTVNFKRTRNGYSSDEPQTPLLPMAVAKIKRSKLKRGRIVFAHDAGENTIYAGKLFRHFLEQRGVEFTGSVRLGRIQGADIRILKYTSRFSLLQVISRLLEHSNNFTANQLLIASGVKVFSAPGTLDKGVKAALSYARKVLGLSDLSFLEGSGISRKNRVSARQINRVLEEFEPQHHLMQREGREFYKTGSLHGISTRAGYIENHQGGLYRYVVMINTPGRSTRPVMRRLMKDLD
jgi:D-alanyl-D-alanine carboxypeptidase/D-alanyl-D-alanine-endopeptidase (penicillin-binding protein 4)